MIDRLRYQVWAYPEQKKESNLDLKRAEQELRVLHEDGLTARKAIDALHSKMQYIERRIDQLGRMIISEREKQGNVSDSGL